MDETPQVEEILTDETPQVEEILTDETPQTGEAQMVEVSQTAEGLTDEETQTAEISMNEEPQTVEVLTDEAPQVSEIPMDEASQTAAGHFSLRDAAPFALVILVTVAVIAFIVAAPSAHAETTTAQGNEYIKQTVEYTLGEADLLPAVCNEGYATSIGCDDVYKWESGSVKNAVNYKVSVENGFGATAYFRTVIALESSADARALIFLNATIADFTWIKVGESINIDGIKYAVYVATYNNPLAAGSTVELVSQIAMKPSVGSSEVATLGNGYNIMVMTQAVAAEAGDTQTVDASFLDTAFGAITASNHPWSGSSDGSSSSTTEASGEASN